MCLEDGPRSQYYKKTFWKRPVLRRSADIMNTASTSIVTWDFWEIDLR